MMDDNLRRAIEADCQKVVLSVAQLLDSGNVEGMGALFTEDCVFGLPTSTVTEPLKGRQAVVAALSKSTAGSVMRHVVTNVVINATSETEAQGRACFTLFRQSREDKAEGPAKLEGALRAMGDYEDTFSKTARGWLISRRIARRIFG